MGTKGNGVKSLDIEKGYYRYQTYNKNNNGNILSWLISCMCVNISFPFKLTGTKNLGMMKKPIYI